MPSNVGLPRPIGVALVVSITRPALSPMRGTARWDRYCLDGVSEPTERYDRGEKWLAYRTIPSLTDFVMVSSTRREVEHYQRLPDGSWTLRPPQRDGESVLASGVILDVNRLYRLVPGLS